MTGVAGDARDVVDNQQDDVLPVVRQLEAPLENHQCVNVGDGDVRFGSYGDSAALEADDLEAVVEGIGVVHAISSVGIGRSTAEAASVHQLNASAS
ncbi:hypothetical protein GM708_15615 [Vibrio cholerae]|nr:hypothetical protein [Vibrio cholerae]